MKKLIFTVCLLGFALLIHTQEDKDCSGDPNVCDSTKFFECNTTEGKCVCMGDSELIPDSDKCVLNYETKCSTDGSLPPCNDEAFLDCLVGSNGEEQCLCNTEWIYNHKENKCALLHGAECQEDEDECYTNSICGETESGRNATCNCLGNLPPNEDRLCFYSYGDSCDPFANDLCDPDKGFVCQSNLRCGCEADGVYSRFLGKCQKPLGGTCSVNDDCLPELSECNVEGKCACKDGLVGGKTGNCVIEHGEPCGSSSIEGSCDKGGNQICKLGKCTCLLDTMEWIPNLNSCYIKKGEDCRNSTISCHPDFVCDAQSKLCDCDHANGKYYDDETGLCKITYGFSCPKDRIGECNRELNLICSDVTGKCDCKKDFIPFLEYDNVTKCFGEFGTPCTGGNDCHLNNSMKCDGVCQCFYNTSQEYNPETRKCHSLVNGFCDLAPSESGNEPSMISCGDNMECRKGNGDQGMCKCKEDYLQIGRRCSNGVINLPGFALLFFSSVLSLVVVGMKNFQ